MTPMPGPATPTFGRLSVSTMGCHQSGGEIDVRVGKDHDLALRLRQTAVARGGHAQGMVRADEVNARVGSSSRKSAQPSVEPLSMTRISLSAGRVAWNCSTVRCNRTDSLVAGRITLIRAG